MLFILLVLLVLMVGAGTLRNIVHRIDRRTVGTLDIARFMGEWFEIARLENRYERGMVAVTAHYTLREDGMVEVVNSGLCPLRGDRKISRGVAKTTSVPGRLRVSFTKLFSSEYNVMELGENYEWALVGSRSASYLWILARRPELDAATFEELKIRAQERGYDIEQLLTVDQSANRKHASGCE